jgi:hypothetical protein
LVTVAEPDLKVMASQIGWDETQLIISVGVGVGLFRGLWRDPHSSFNQEPQCHVLGFLRDGLCFGRAHERGWARGSSFRLLSIVRRRHHRPGHRSVYSRLWRGLSRVEEHQWALGRRRFRFDRPRFGGPDHHRDDHVASSCRSMKLSYNFDTSALLASGLGRFLECISRSKGKRWSSMNSERDDCHFAFGCVLLDLQFIFHSDGLEAGCWYFHWPHLCLLGLVIFLSAVSVAFLPIAQEFGFALGELAIRNSSPSPS